MPRYELNVNGKPTTVDVQPNTLLLDVLRDHLDLTGTKYGCGEGQCGSCTVLLDGKARKSCLVAVSQVGQQPVETVEGLQRDGKLHPLQEAFLKHGAFQCGYCTPGMLMAAKALLSETPKPTRDQARRAMNGNLCRCGAYGRILDAILEAAEGGSRA
ncbi:MAG: (2Fe-2S)-binding protein [Bryobacterales bacterium]|jgi:aerobic-type carbon monoxide dehydrogenase small subunit (CoxS/CutS family)|nr:(2Fe-2S)-binding protein [Bryobacterales bacterium]